MNQELLKIRHLAHKEQKQWPSSLRASLQPAWLKTLKDDRLGMISCWSLEILKDTGINTALARKYARQLGAAALYFWTAANLQDDLSDNQNNPKYFLPLSENCLVSGQSLSFASMETPAVTRKKWDSLWHELHETNFNELLSPKKIPKNNLASAGKSLFLLSGPILLINYLNWPKRDQVNFLKAGKYLLAAKQLADDVYDYQEDWLTGRRTSAHRGLKALPTKQQLPAYYRKQALAILSLCRRARTTIKTIPLLQQQTCLDIFLTPIETNAQRALAKLN